MSFGCHNCSHDAEIARLRDICVKCKRCNGDRVKIGGRTHVSLDAARDENCRALILSRAEPDFRQPTGDEADRVNVPREVLPYLRRLIMEVVDLGDDDILLLAGMMRGERLVDHARRRGVTLQAVYARWKRITTLHPAWLSLANGMIGSGRGRKPGKVRKARNAARKA